MITQIKCFFVTPDGTPLANADIEIKLFQSSFSDKEGVVIPRLLYFTTDDIGQVILSLVSSPEKYSILVQDLESAAEAFYEFYVPESDDPVRLQDLVHLVPPTNQPYDVEAIRQITDAKAASKAAAITATSASERAEADKNDAYIYKTQAEAAEAGAQQARAQAQDHESAAGVSRDSAADSLYAVNAAAVVLIAARDDAITAATGAELSEAQATDSARIATEQAASATGSATTASAAMEAAQLSEVAANESRQTAELSEASVLAAKASVDTSTPLALQAKQDAVESAVAAKASEDAAKASESAAQVAAAQVAVDRNAVANDKALVTQKTAEAAASALTAEGHAATTTAKAAQSVDAAASAEGFKTQADQAATSAQTASNTSIGAKADAEVAAAAAVAAKQAAESAQTSATASKDTVLLKATEVEAKRAAAATSASQATSSAQEAKASKDAAATSASQAEASQAAALAAQQAAESARNDAQDSVASITGALVELGSVDLSSGSYPAIPVKAGFWKVTVGGTVEGIDYGSGDTLIYSQALDEFYKVDNTESVSSINGKKGAVTLTKQDLNLGQVDNTQDMSKPVSTAQKAALDDKEGIIALGTADEVFTGSKSWKDFPSWVRSVVLSGLSTATTTIVAATDTVVVAVGKLQAQITSLGDSKLDKTANAASATKLATPRAINGVAFDGTAPITIGADWSNVSNKPATYAPTAHGHTIADVSGLQGASVGHATNASGAGTLTINNVESKAVGQLQFFQMAGNADIMPDTGWWNLIRAQHAGYPSGYWRDLALSFTSDSIKTRRNINGVIGPWQEICFTDHTHTPASIGAAPAVHSHDYLPTAGGTINGAITSTAPNIIVGYYGGAIRGYLWNDTTGFGLVSSNTSWAVRVVYGTQNVEMPGIVYAGALHSSGVVNASDGVLASKSSQTNYATAALKAEAPTGDVIVSFHASGVTAASIRHVRGGSGIRVEDASNILAPVTASQFIGSLAGHASSAGALSSGATLSDVTNSGWYRSTGQQGWYSETYQGGIYMEDASYVRTYNGKGFLVANAAMRIESAQPQIQLYDTDHGILRYLYADGGTMGFLMSDGNWGLQSDNAGNLTTTGNVAGYSDIRLKTNIEVIPNALDKVDQLRGVVFDRTDNGTRQTGLIAQEVQAVLPEAVGTEGEYLTVAYGNLVGLLVEAIKELRAEVNELREDLKDAA